MADEEPVDQKKYLEDSCKPKCVRPLRAYQSCIERIKGDESGHKHCTGQYFDYWSCVDECDSMDFAGSMLDGGFGEQATAGDNAGEVKFKSKNLEAERKRRDKLKHRLLELRSMVPKITKMSKESILTDAIDYIQKLQKQISDLKLELSEIPDDVGEEHGSPSIRETAAPAVILQCPAKVELSAVGQNKFHVKITCKNKPGVFVTLLEAMARNRLDITEISSFTFSGFAQMVFSIEANNHDGEVPIDELRKFLSVMS